MKETEEDFLPDAIGLLKQLHETSGARGLATLTLLLDLAKTEAEDALKSTLSDAALRETLRQTSTVGAWH